MIYCTLPWGFLHVLWAVCQMTPEFRDQRKRPLVGQHGKIQSIKWANICKLAVSWWFKWWYNMIFDIYIHVTCSHVLFDLHIYIRIYIHDWHVVLHVARGAVQDGTHCDEVTLCVIWCFAYIRFWWFAWVSMTHSGDHQGIPMCRQHLYHFNT